MRQANDTLYAVDFFEVSRIFRVSFHYFLRRGIVRRPTRRIFMSLTPADVARIAKLARLELSPNEAETTRSQLNAVFSIFEQLQAVDTTGVAPMTHPTTTRLRLREDLVSETDQRAAYQKVAPETEGGLYLVPKVIE
jgi:aspartyl-tRNA(Asn)/glutamyl-tRNA(Gln) amidotransferase subunit C